MILGAVAVPVPPVFTSVGGRVPFCAEDSKSGLEFSGAESPELPVAAVDLELWPLPVAAAGSGQSWLMVFSTRLWDFSAPLEAPRRSFRRGGDRRSVDLSRRTCSAPRLEEDEVPKISGADSMP